jgi:glycosyltransferase involved in cell wall biosynthesis
MTYKDNIETVDILLIANSGRAHEILPLLTGQCLKTAANIRKIVELAKKKYRPSIVMVEGFGRWIILGLLASILMKAPIIFRIRGDFFSEEVLRRNDKYNHFAWIRYFINVIVARIILNRAKGIVYNSRYLKNRMKRINVGKVIGMVHNPLMTPKITKENKADKLPQGFILLTVTNMNLSLKVNILIRKLLSIPKKKWEEWNLYWYICGDGVLKEELKRQITKAGLDENVIFTGRVNDIGLYYKACHVYVHFTSMDAFPNATMEAMFFNKPVITNRYSCGTREQVFDGYNGLVIDDNAEIVDAIDYYYCNPCIKEKHGDNGHKLVTSKFTIPKQRNRMREYIERFQRGVSDS